MLAQGQPPAGPAAAAKGSTKPLPGAADAAKPADGGTGVGNAPLFPSLFDGLLEGGLEEGSSLEGRAQPARHALEPAAKPSRKAEALQIPMLTLATVAISSGLNGAAPLPPVVLADDLDPSTPSPASVASNVEAVATLPPMQAADEPPRKADSESTPSSLPLPMAPGSEGPVTLPSVPRKVVAWLPATSAAAAGVPTSPADGTVLAAGIPPKSSERNTTAPLPLPAAGEVLPAAPLATGPAVNEVGAKVRQLLWQAAVPEPAAVEIPSAGNESTAQAPISPAAGLVPSEGKAVASDAQVTRLAVNEDGAKVRQLPGPPAAPEPSAVEIPPRGNADNATAPLASPGQTAPADGNTLAAGPQVAESAVPENRSQVGQQPGQPSVSGEMLAGIAPRVSEPAAAGPAARPTHSLEPSHRTPATPHLAPVAATQNGGMAPAAATEPPQEIGSTSLPTPAPARPSNQKGSERLSQSTATQPVAAFPARVGVPIYQWTVLLDSAAGMPAVPSQVATPPLTQGIQNIGEAGSGNDTGTQFHPRWEAGDDVSPTLSGPVISSVPQVAQTVPDTPPEPPKSAPAPAAAQTGTEPPSNTTLPAPGAATSGMEQPAAAPPLAFAAHLMPLTAQEEAPPTAQVAWQRVPTSAAKSADPVRLPADVPNRPVTAVAPPGGASTDPQSEPSPAQSRNKPDKKQPALEEPAKTEAPRTAAGEAGPVNRPSTHVVNAVEPQAERPSGGQAATPPDGPSRPKESVEASASAEPGPAPGAARDIRLEVGGGDSRVEVRLMERDGEVHVAVRTPDEHLAGALREDLPALSSRLTESGFRTETWHPSASQAGEWQRQAEPAAGSSAQDSNQQPRQNGREQHQGDQPPARPKMFEETVNRKEKGNFEWLMSTLQ